MGPFGEDCDLKDFGKRIAQRGGGIARKKAKVAVARKLAITMLALWRNIRISKSTARKLNPLKNIVYAAIKENIRIKINKERFSRNCFLSSPDDLCAFLNQI